MPPELTNLLPADLATSFRRDYFLRLAALGAGALALAILINGVLLTPSHLLLSSRADIEETHLAELTRALEASDESTIDARLAALKKESSFLLGAAKTTIFSPVLVEIFKVPRAGVKLTSFTFEPARGESTGRLIMSGVAASRDALRSYVLLLKDVPGINDASVPLSAYAKEEDISFQATLSLSPSVPSP